MSTVQQQSNQTTIVKQGGNVFLSQDKTNLMPVFRRLLAQNENFVVRFVRVTVWEYSKRVT